MHVERIWKNRKEKNSVRYWNKELTQSIVSCKHLQNMNIKLIWIFGFTPQKLSSKYTKILQGDKCRM